MSYHASIITESSYTTINHCPASKPRFAYRVFRFISACRKSHWRRRFDG